MPRPRGLILAISGLPGAGKTTLAAHLGIAIGGEARSFSAYVRDLLPSQRDAAPNRAALQRFGDAIVRDGPHAFVHRFLSRTGDDERGPLILDGLRHAAVREELVRYSLRHSLLFLHVHVSTGVEVRAQRRTDGDLNMLREIDEHPAEAEAETLLVASAHLVVDGSRDPRIAAATILDAIRTQEASDGGAAAAV